MALGLGLAGMNQSNLAAEGVLEDLDELRGEGDFWDEEDDRFLSPQSVLGKFEIDIGLAAAGDAVEEFGRSSSGLERF